MISNSTRNSWLNEVYLQFRDKIYRYCYRKLNSREEAEDLVSKVFLEVTRCVDSFDKNKASESTWIYTICRNLLNRYLRDGYTHRRIIPIAAEDPEDYGAEAEEIERYIQADELASGLAQLSEDKRNIVILSFYHGLAPGEIAERLGLSYTNICVLKSRALKELKATLAR